MMMVIMMVVRMVVMMVVVAGGRGNTEAVGTTEGPLVGRCTDGTNSCLTSRFISFIV